MLGWLDRFAQWYLRARYDWVCHHDPVVREHVERFGMKSVKDMPGGWEATFVTPAAVLIANDMAEMLDKAQAKNYVQFDFMPRLDRGMKPVRVTVQWADGESPAAKAARLEDRAAKLEDELDKTNNTLLVLSSELEEAKWLIKNLIESRNGGSR